MGRTTVFFAQEIAQKVATALASLRGAEGDEAIQRHGGRTLDCFATLSKTRLACFAYVLFELWDL